MIDTVTQEFPNGTGWNEIVCSSAESFDNGLRITTGGDDYDREVGIDRAADSGDKLK
jgi:hypothetical protein